MLSTQNTIETTQKFPSADTSSPPIDWYSLIAVLLYWNVMSHHHMDWTAAGTQCVLQHLRSSGCLVRGGIWDHFIHVCVCVCVIPGLGGLRFSYTPTLNLYTCSRTHTGSRRPCSWMQRTTSKIVSSLSAFVFLFPLFFQGCVCFPGTLTEEQKAVLVLKWLFPPQTGSRFISAALADV